MCNRVSVARGRRLFWRVRGRRARQAGFTLVELAISGVVLTVGLLALAGLVATAVAANGRSRLDSTATMLAQAVIEQINVAYDYTYLGGIGDATITDCVNPAWTINQAPGGAPLNSSGNIDFSQAQVDGYYMNYVVCNANAQTTYDVRWNIQALSGTTSYTHLVTVGVRMKAGNGVGPAQVTFPMNLKVFVGPDPPYGS